MNNKTFRDREILHAAHERGAFSTLFAFFRLSGPGWLQSAITLGGGSLGGALYLGMLGGTSMLWLQLIAIVIGVIMLSAISHVTLSTGKRPYHAINEYVNPVLGVGWITATILANMIWILPQFGLAYDAIDKNLTPDGVTAYIAPTGEDATAEEVAEADQRSKMAVSGGLALLAFVIVVMSFNPGWMSKIFDLLLKLIVGMIVVCFVGVVYKLFESGSIDWNLIAQGFIPNINHWNAPAPSIEELMKRLPQTTAEFWGDRIVSNQRNSMIGVTATAVGLNMTFLLPYSMLARGWDKPFRGLAKFDLVTGMAIPYIVVTSCIVIASAHAFHATADENFLSNDPAVMQTSPFYGSTTGQFTDRYGYEKGEDALAALNDMEADEKAETLAKFAAALKPEEKRLALTLVKPNAKQLAVSLQPLLGERNANLVFGIGAVAMGFSSIIILMLINGYAFAEMFGNSQSNPARVLGALAAVIMGFFWFEIWQGESKTWLIIVASTFGAILLPIAYVSFFALMNNRRLLGPEKPAGFRMLVWNLLMGIGVIGAFIQAYGGLATRVEDPNTGTFVIGGVATFVLLAVIGFSARRQDNADDYV